MLSLLLRSSSFFCTANLSSTFRIRSKLSEFFKHTHPDVLQNAPQKIKEENMRSLKNLNGYIDAVSQLKQIEGKLLRFYVAEKSNNKSKKYYSFEVELPEVNAKVFQDAKQAGQLISNITDVLNSKFMESRSHRNPNIKKPSESASSKPQPVVETEQERFERLQHEIDPFRKNKDYKRKLFEQRLSTKAHEAYKQSEKDSLMGELQQKVFFANTPANKPLMWSRLAMKESGVYRDYQQVLDNLLDPKLIYFAEDLNAEEIETCKVLDKVVKKTLLPGNSDFRMEIDRQALTKVFAEMESHEPPTCLYVSRKYSASDMPGFLTVPFKFVPKELVANYHRLKPTIGDERVKYEQYYDIYRSLSAELLRVNHIKVEFGSFKNNADISRKILMLKRLTRYRCRNDTQFVPLDEDEHAIFCKEYKKEPAKSCHLVNSKVVLKCEFSDEELAALLSATAQ